MELDFVVVNGFARFFSGGAVEDANASSNGRFCLMITGGGDDEARFEDGDEGNEGLERLV